MFQSEHEFSVLSLKVLDPNSATQYQKHKRARASFNVLCLVAFELLAAISYTATLKKGNRATSDFVLIASRFGNILIYLLTIPIKCDFILPSLVVILNSLELMAADHLQLKE